MRSREQFTVSCCLCTWICWNSNASNLRVLLNPKFELPKIHITFKPHIIFCWIRQKLIASLAHNWVSATSLLLSGFFLFHSTLNSNCANIVLDQKWYWHCGGAPAISRPRWHPCHLCYTGLWRSERTWVKVIKQNLKHQLIHHKEWYTISRNSMIQIDMILNWLGTEA